MQLYIYTHRDTCADIHFLGQIMPTMSSTKNNMGSLTSPQKVTSYICLVNKMTGPAITRADGLV